jgi:NAD-dependent deacetylase
MPAPDDLRRLAALFAAARRAVAFTGAGVSTESGNPDFRSPGGLWDRFDPRDFREDETACLRPMPR